MPLMFIFVVGIAVAVIRRHFLVAPENQPSGDPPARLLGWAAGQLAAERNPWGQAMIGELDQLDGTARRWRFALGCVAGAVAMPPWGRAAAVLGALTAVAAGGGALVAYTHVHYRLHADGWTWVAAAVLMVTLAGYILGGSALLRRPRVAGPGLIGGLLIATAWLAEGGFTFDAWLNSPGSRTWLVLLAPIVVGVGSTWWGGNADVGRRAARLAAVTAALSTYLYGVLAVAVHGAIGHDPSDGWSTAQIVDDNLGNQAVFYLFALPLATATVGWAAAAATARLRRDRPSPTGAGGQRIASGPARELTGALGPAASGSGPAPEAHATREHRRPSGAEPDTTAATAVRRRRFWYAMVLCAALGVVAVLVLLTLQHPH